MLQHLQGCGWFEKSLVNIITKVLFLEDDKNCNSKYRRESLTKASWLMEHGFKKPVKCFDSKPREAPACWPVSSSKHSRDRQGRLCSGL